MKSTVGRFIALIIAGAGVTAAGEPQNLSMAVMDDGTRWLYGCVSIEDAPRFERAGFDYTGGPANILCAAPHVYMAKQLGR